VFRESFTLQDHFKYHGRTFWIQGYIKYFKACVYCKGSQVTVQGRKFYIRIKITQLGVRLEIRDSFYIQEGVHFY
jgi:hypothetical protein